MKQTLTLDQIQRTPFETALILARKLGEKAGDRMATDFWAQQEAAQDLSRLRMLFNRPEDVKQIEEVIDIDELNPKQVVELRDAWTEGYDSAFGIERIL